MEVIQNVLMLDGKHENDPKIGKSVPLKVVETSSLNLIKKIPQDGKLVRPLDLKIVGLVRGHPFRTPL
jgi:hypothetical protein